MPIKKKKPATKKPAPKAGKRTKTAVKKLPAFANSLEVLHISPEQQDFPQCIGITAERAEFLGDAIQDMLPKQGILMGELAVNTSKLAVHQNELYFIGIVVGRIVENGLHMARSAGLMEMIRGGLNPNK